jgi:hypothetical protein
LTPKVTVSGSLGSGAVSRVPDSFPVVVPIVVLPELGRLFESPAYEAVIVWLPVEDGE